MKMNRIIPMLPVKSMPASIEFYQKLGFSVERKNEDWGWAMLSFGECRLMVDQSILPAGPQLRREASKAGNQHGLMPSQSVLYFYPENLAEYHRHVRENGLEIPDIDDTFYDMTEFRLEDPDGNRLWIGQNKTSQA